MESEIRTKNSSMKCHYNDVIMSTMASQITSISNVCQTICSGTDHGTENIKAPRYYPLWGGSTRDSPHKGPVTRKIFPFDDVIMGPQFFMSMLDLAKISAIETDLHTNVLSHFLRPPSTTGLKTGKKDWPVMGICTSNNLESSLSPFRLKSWKFSTDQAWSLYCNSVIIHWYGNLHLIRNTIFHVERLYPK